MTELNRSEMQALIAKNIAAILEEMCETSLTVNLGVGMPLKVVDYLENENIYIHTENGMVGVGPLAYGDDVHPDLINAGRQPVTETIGCVYTDASESFGMIRGGHIDAAVLGAFEIDREANIANWIIPNTTLLGVGGAMDLVAGAKTVIVAMVQTKDGQAKFVEHCSLPVTGYHEVDYVVTEMGVFHFTAAGLILEKIHPSTTPVEVRQTMEFDFIVSDTIENMVL